MSPTAVSQSPVLRTTASHKSAIAPAIPAFVPPPVTTAEVTWADLETIDLQLLDSPDPSVRAQLVAATKKALVEDGFLFVTGTGVTDETLNRHLAIAQYATSLPLEEKQPYAADLEAGSYEGYKLRGIWAVRDGVKDNIEHYNLESSSFDPGFQHPDALRPLIPEIKAFAEHTYKFVVYRILKLISLALELPEDYLWALHDHDKIIGASCQRYMGYFPRGDDDDKPKDIYIRGHTDYNSISLLYSQPITALQILAKNDEWKYVRHVPGAVVVNTADALEFLSGGVFKATRHRVVRPPLDQADLIRYILIHFARTRRDLPLNPIWESPVVKAAGTNPFQDRIDAGGKAPTQDEWLRERIRRTGNSYAPSNKGGSGVNNKVEEEILGTKVQYYT
ncbi:uncharacterized protein EHS24_004546 [Apiotrichum porosum]|uniref:Fe2OG dioxygenase domain-containing protein n=1 Tax=Apiotrichum porosum TaxID=105984 RepID=A0A427Y5F2_9TREE|nr:uncharacterized protein EHS24_004546 [Apiotrichum porosum]RSH86304.1 hypothetical protein EHS24_004546 [Apiotrichum porosum]